jgi:hypothetical protein
MSIMLTGEKRILADVRLLKRCGGAEDRSLSARAARRRILREEVRVYVVSIPPESRPWMSAGGMLVPTALGLMLLGVRAVLSKRMSWYLSATMIVFGLLFLMGNLGCVSEMFQYNAYPNRHVNAVATHFDLQGAGMPLVVLSAPLLTQTVYALVGCRIYQATRPALGSFPAGSRASKP